MRLLSFLLISLSVSLAAPLAVSTNAAHAEVVVSRKANTEKLEKLYTTLRRSKSEKIAGDIANDIREVWMQSGSGTVDLLMLWAQNAIDANNNIAALDYLDQVVTLKPDFAEGWNRRATLHFMMNNYPKAMADIERTLALEPRHFGALSGMGMIFLSLENKELALSAYRKALDVYPMMRDVQKTVGDLEDQITGSKI